jgi:hypothetical protein
LKEKESKDAIEEMLLTYKEEVDTLNEALKIAAMDIAEVAQADDEDFDSEEGSSVREGGDEGDEVPPPATSEVDDDAADFVDAVSSVLDGDKRRNRETLMRLVRRDAPAGGGGAASGGGGGSGGAGAGARGQTGQGGTTFVIHDDGTFERK